jgi:hypothetical protein
LYVLNQVSYNDKSSGRTASQVILFFTVILV